MTETMTMDWRALTFHERQALHLTCEFCRRQGRGDAVPAEFVGPATLCFHCARTLERCTQAERDLLLRRF